MRYDTSAIAPHGLLGLATSTLTHSGAAIRALFTLLSAPLPSTTPSPNPTYPILIHCTQGKDRTGLSILLLLLLLHAPLSAIAADYAASEAELLPELDERLAQIRAMGLPDVFAHCEDGWAESLSQWLEERYGGVEAYLGSVDVGREECGRVRNVLGVRGAFCLPVSSYLFGLRTMCGVSSLQHYCSRSSGALSPVSDFHFAGL
ncbi:protein-tyrosine phosphatase-like protein [Cryomyces antarcticus]